MCPKLGGSQGRCWLMESLEGMVSSLWDQEQTSAEQVTGINLRETDRMSVLLPEKFTAIHSK